MATSKLLKPTNVTISIPEFTDQPDQRVNSNCIDKEADAINTLSEQMTNTDLYNFSTSTGTWPSAITLQGDSFIYSYGKIATMHLNFKIQSANVTSHTISNAFPAKFRPMYTTSVVCGDGVTDGVGQPVEIRADGSIILWNTKTGTTYAQGDVTYIMTY